MASRLRSIFCTILASSLILVSPGVSSYRAVAAEFEGPAGKPAITPLPLVNANLGKGIVIPGAEIQTGVTIPGAQIPGLGVNAEIPLLLPTPNAGLAAPGAGANVEPGTPAAQAQSLSKLSEALSPQIEAAADSANADPRATGERIEQLIEGRSLAVEAEAAIAESRRTGSDYLPAAELPNPYGLYRHAYPIAVARAEGLGKKPSQVHFYEASASIPGVDGASWKFAFYLTDKETTPAELSKEKPKVGGIIYVDFHKSGFGSRGRLSVSDDSHLDAYLARTLDGQTRFSAPRSYLAAYDLPRVSVYVHAPLSPDWVPFTSDPAYFKLGSQTSAQSALETGRREGLSGGVSVSFKMRERPVSGDKDFWYSFHDDAGNNYLANGLSRETRWLKKAPEAPAETPQGRLARFVSSGKALGFTAGAATAVGLFSAAMNLPIESDLALKAKLLAMLVTPLLMVLSWAGLTELGGKLGAWAADPKLGVVGQGALTGVATIAAAALIAAAMSWPAFTVLATLATIELVLGLSFTISALIDSRGKLDYKNDFLSRLSGKLLVAAAVSGLTLASVAGWLFYTFAGTIKDTADAKIFPMHDGLAPLYAKAAAAAMKAAEGKGYKPGQLYLASMEARDALDSDKGWTVQFIAKKTPEDGEGEIINAYLYPGKAEGDWTASAYAYGKTQLSSDTKLLKFMTDIKRATPKNLADALSKAAKALGVTPAELGFELQPWRDADAWGTDLAYVFDTVDGRRWGINARTGKKLALADTGVSVIRIEAAAKSAASYKGRPWSQTEYNMSQSMAADALRRDGASPAQLRLFQKLCDAAPVRGGGFNPWSGD